MIRSQLLTDFRKRWEEDAALDGDDLPMQQQRENAFEEGLDQVPRELYSFRMWIGAKPRSMHEVVQELYAREKAAGRVKGQ